MQLISEERNKVKVAIHPAYGTATLYLTLISLQTRIHEMSRSYTLQSSLFIRVYIGHGCGGEHHGNMNKAINDDLARPTCETDSA